jgi:hypothetical protein
VAAGWHGDVPHPTPRRQVFCNLTGEYEVTTSDGETRRFPGGSLLLLEDTSGQGHSTRVVSADAVLIVGMTSRREALPMQVTIEEAAAPPRSDPL